MLEKIKNLNSALGGFKEINKKPRKAAKVIKKLRKYNDSKPINKPMSKHKNKTRPAIQRAESPIEKCIRVEQSSADLIINGL